jgi:hypothetical protein
MNILTRQQKRVLNGIKYFSAEYQGGVPYNILKLDLDVTEEDLNPILAHLENENYIYLQEGIILLEQNRGSKNNEKGVDVPEETQLKESPKGTVENNVFDSPDVDTEDVNNTNPSDDVGDSGVINSSADVEDVNDTTAEDSGNTEETEEVELKDQLSDSELKSLEIIEKLTDDSGNISRTILEGNLLYGELELSSIKLYNMITSLENKGILKKIKLTDGEYYKFTPN